MFINETFNNDLNNNMWENETKNCTMDIVNNQLSFNYLSGGWGGAYLYTKKPILVSNSDKIVCEFDFCPKSAHYSSADCPYLLIGSSTNIGREQTGNNSNYLMRTDSHCLWLFIGQSTDTNTISQLRLNNNFRTGNLGVYTIDSAIGINIHLKIELDIKNEKINIYYNNSSNPVISTVIPNWDDIISINNDVVIEFNWNSYGKYLCTLSNILINNFSYYYLLKDNNTNIYYTYDKISNNIIQDVSQELTIDNFKQNGFNDLMVISAEQLKAATLNKINIQLLGYTDETTITESSIIYNVDEYRPIDKLNDQFQIKKYIPNV